MSGWLGSRLRDAGLRPTFRGLEDEHPANLTQELHQVISARCLRTARWTFRPSTSSTILESEQTDTGRRPPASGAGALCDFAPELVRGRSLVPGARQGSTRSPIPLS